MQIQTDELKQKNESGDLKVHADELAHALTLYTSFFAFFSLLY